MRNYFKSITVLTCFLFILAGFVFPQNLDLPSPREEKLLNGLKVLIWKKPETGKVKVNLRIHSGAAFDPQDKEGTMALLADIFFPEESLKNYFEEDLEGKLEVKVTYDYIQINTEAKPEEFLTVIQTIAQAVSNPTIDKETLEKVKARRLEKLAELENDPKYVADRAVAKRLFGSFPYGRPIEGTRESLAKIDFADLVFNEERFLTADNATLTISGEIDPSYAYKAARRLLGGWNKSLKKVPANFRLPEEPDKKLSIIPTKAENVSELRFASKGIARNDDAFFANLILAKILENRMVSKGQNSVDLKENLLPGYVAYNFSDWNVGMVKMIGNKIPLPEDIDGDVSRLFSEKITSGEFEKAKKDLLKKL